MLDAIIDSAGGDIMGQTGKILKLGGRVVCYGMCVVPPRRRYHLTNISASSPLSSAPLSARLPRLHTHDLIGLSDL